MLKKKKHSNKNGIYSLENIFGYTCDNLLNDIRLNYMHQT